MARVIKVGAEAFSGGEFENIPVGSKLRMSVFDIEETVTGPNSKKPGSPQLVFTAKVTEDFTWTGASGQSQQARGREIRYNYVPLDPDAAGAWRLTSFAKAVGWKADPQNGVELPDNVRDALGTEFVGTIGQNAGQDGRVYNTVARFAPVTGGGQPEVKTEAARWGEV